MGISIAAVLIIYIPIAGLIMLANIRQRAEMKRLYTKSVAALRLVSVKKGISR